MKLYGIKTCDTCRKALKALPNAAFVDVRATPLDRAELQRFLDAFGADLVNTRSTTWRGLSEAERSADPLDQLTAHPTLMKRPVIDDGTLYLGWGKDVQAALV
ncbi:arsenate reductase family protein [Litoreibacter janthinus]|uniref:Arsenate reductase, glutaredoxin family n=1 Tax=Litoreibacter janthinus TaxID=670154 RepID=A0A1I6HGB2_9RHOB|nr:ArsC/Spx/MgsR family protein [Litoreibacter janthinus]SFR53408.1 Arsenate reductase, glutaredoxin family [Litoreibacter janthinus]